MTIIMKLLKCSIWKELIYSLLILGAATCIGLLFSYLGFTEANIITIFLLAILLASLLTTSRWWSLLNSLASVLINNVPHGSVFSFSLPSGEVNLHE